MCANHAFVVQTLTNSRLTSGYHFDLLIMILKATKIKLKLQGLGKETLKRLTSYLGQPLEQCLSKTELGNTSPLIRTPDFYNTRVNRIHGKNLMSVQSPQ
jgi:hypothetical protein